MKTPVQPEDGTRIKAKRDKILAGARRVFLREGFMGASTDMLAKESSVSKRTLYAYYPSKEDLFADLLRSLTIDHPQTRILDFVREAAPCSPEELRTVLMTIAEKAIIVLTNAEYVALIRTIIADSHRFPRLAELVRSTIPELMLNEVGAMLHRGQRDGIVVQGDLDVLTRLYIGPLLSYAVIDGLLRPESQPQRPSKEKIAELVSLFLKAILKNEELERKKQ